MTDDPPRCQPEDYPHDSHDRGSRSWQPPEDARCAKCGEHSPGPGGILCPKTPESHRGPRVPIALSPGRVARMRGPGTGIPVSWNWCRAQSCSAAGWASWASTTAMAAMLTISGTSAPGSGRAPVGPCPRGWARWPLRRRGAAEACRRRWPLPGSGRRARWPRPSGRERVVVLAQSGESATSAIISPSTTRPGWRDFTSAWLRPSWPCGRRGWSRSSRTTPARSGARVRSSRARSAAMTAMSATSSAVGSKLTVGSASTTARPSWVTIT